MTGENAQEMQTHLDNLTKPKGSLGNLEDYALRLAAIQGRIPPRVDLRISIIFAGDHGIADEGVSLYPKEVTAQMVLNFLTGGAAINVLSKHCGSDVWAVDAGVASEIGADGVIDMKIGPGTRNFAREEAMNDEELDRCFENGKTLAARVADEGYDLVSIGDMGIGNTTTAAALLVANGFALEDVVDRGTGIDADTLRHKLDIVAKAVKKHGPFSDVRASMRCLGGFEICMIAGFILGLKGKKIACVIDGFPVTTGAFLAWSIDNKVSDFLFAGHRSKVKGHTVTLEKMGIEPIIDLNMRLGEGTGAVLGGFLVSLGAKIASEMASFDSAGISRSEGDEENY
jgi:nicotinate-nucleotide--dimethylbenzimidazole phosphoribosyltransferase